MADPSGGYNYKRVKVDGIKADRLCSPVIFTGVKAPKLRMSLLPKNKIAPTNPTRAGPSQYSAVCDGVALQGDQIVIVRPPALHHIDDLLTLVGNMYYQQSEAGKSNAQWSLIRRTTLGLLTSPMREFSVIDRWSPYEVALFESAICLVGKNFPQISNVIKTKTTGDCVEFYYIWKKSKNYLSWKPTYKHLFGYETSWE